MTTPSYPEFVRYGSRILGLPSIFVLTELKAKAVGRLREA